MNVTAQTSLLLDADIWAHAAPVLATLGALQQVGFRSVTFAARTRAADPDPKALR